MSNFTKLAYSAAADNTALVILVPLEHVTKRNDVRALETRIGLTSDHAFV